GAIEEEVTVTAVSPVVDTKKTAVGQNVTQEILQSLPTARDPWVVLQMAPSIIVDRENVGGVESGQQSSYVARGAGSYSNNVWAMDGIVITDPAAIGASPSYYDFDAFEEMQVTVGGADVTVQTGGVALNMVTRRGGNKITLGGRFYMVDEKFQAKNAEYVAEVQLDEPGFLGVNLIRNNKDYGFNLGGPLVKDKAWLWGSYGVQDIKTTTVYQQPDDTLLVNYAAKLNVQIIPENRFEAFMHVGGKNKWGRSSSAANPAGLYQGGRYHFGSPILKFQDEHMFGDNLFVSLKYAFSDAGFNLTPMTDLDFVTPSGWDVTNDTYENPDGNTSLWRYYVERPVNQYNFLLNYFNDSLFGVSHDIKVGFEYADRNAYTESVTPGNFYYNWNYDSPTIDLDALPAPYGTSTYDGVNDIPTDAENVKYFSYFRGYYRDYGVSALSAYFSDTITFGKFNVLLGLRYDRQVPRLNPSTILTVTDNPAWETITGGDTAISDALGTLLPGIDMTDEYQTLYDVNGDKWGWTFWSPRLGLTWDITGDGKTIGKASFALYGDFMGTGSYNQMPGGTGGWVDFWWLDQNRDEELEFTELYWRGTGLNVPVYQPYNVFNAAGTFLPTTLQIEDANGTGWGGVASWATRNDLTAPYDELDPTYGSTRTTEFMLTVEREVFTDFALTVNATYRRYDQFNWSWNFFVPDQYTVITERHEQSTDWYVNATSTVADALPPASYDVTGVDTLWDGDTGEAPDHDWYYLNPAYTEGADTFNTALSTPYQRYERRPGFYRDYYGVDIIFNKRLSDKWMLNGSLTWQHQEAHYPAESVWNDQNLWALDGLPYAASIGGASGKINQYVYSRWLVKAGGLYQLPYDLNVSFTFLAREGWPLQETIGYYDYRLPNTRNRSFTSYIHPFGEFRLSTFYRFDLRLEKVINLGDTGRIYLMADLFNVFNAKLENRRYQRTWGTIYHYTDNHLTFTRSATAYTLNEILNPRILRLGVRFQF
ncbi:MAG: Plug domain-containing protein, partial [Candidatus Aminicenantes bacterium]|nr:Plug domain-containing protein [Candidatus Aminicenantes bacterium]